VPPPIRASTATPASATIACAASARVASATSTRARASAAIRARLVGAVARVERREHRAELRARDEQRQHVERRYRPRRARGRRGPTPSSPSAAASRFAAPSSWAWLSVRAPSERRGGVGTTSALRRTMSPINMSTGGSLPAPEPEGKRRDRRA
jgi:hypothetical protein